MPAPLVSVVIPTYNQKQEWLCEAVNSVLAQTAVPCEAIVVDDGSEAPFVFTAPVRVIRHNENRGIAAALNTGIKAMRAEWFAWLSSDDVFATNKLELQLAACEKYGAKASMHPYAVYDPKGQLVGFSTPPPLMVEAVQRAADRGEPPLDAWQWPTLTAQRQDFGTNCWVNGSTCLIHRSVIDDVGGLDESYKYGQDYEWWCRIGRKYRWLMVNRVLGIRREGENLTEKLRNDKSLWDEARAEDRRLREAHWGAQ